nr:proline-rich protein 36-like [Nerophis lumbriciformis]
MQWQQELEQSSKSPTVVLSPSSGLCTIYEALENSDDEGREGELKREESVEENIDCERRLTPHGDDSSQKVNGDHLSPFPPDSPERPPPLDLDWGKKVDIVQQLINQTLLLNGDGCSSLLLLPGGAGGTLSPLESSLWPSLLPPITPPSATVTSVSSFSPETAGSSPQGEWTVVELETHH